MARCVSSAGAVPRPRCVVSLQSAEPSSWHRVPATAPRAGRMESLRSPERRPRPGRAVRRGDRSAAGLAEVLPDEGRSGPGATRPLGASCAAAGASCGEAEEGRRGGQCQAGGLAFRSGRSGTPARAASGARVTAAAVRQLSLPALLPAPGPGRCTLPASDPGGRLQGRRTGLDQAPG